MALFDSGSCESFVTANLVEELGLAIIPSNRQISMASSSLVI